MVYKPGETQSYEKNLAKIRETEENLQKEAAAKREATLQEGRTALAKIRETEENLQKEAAAKREAATKLTPEELEKSRELHSDIDKIKDLLAQEPLKPVNRKNLNIVLPIKKGLIVNVADRLTLLTEGPLSLVQFFKQEVTLEDIQERLKN